MDMTKYLYQFVMCNFEVAKELIFLIFIIGFPTIFSKKKIIYIGALSAIAMFLGCLWVEEIFYPFLYMFMALLGAALVIAMKNTSRFLLAVISFLCISEVDYFLGALFRLANLTEIWEENTVSLVVSITALLIWCIFAGLCVHNEISFYRRKASKNKAFIIIEVIVLLINIGVLTIMFGILSESKGKKEIMLLLAAMVILFIASTVSLIFYSSALDVKKYKHLDRMNRVYLNAQKEHFEKIKQNDKESRSFRHDINNHLMVLNNLLTEGKTDKAKDYLCDMCTKLESTKIKICTGNDIVDAIINEKAEKAKREEISIVWNGIFPTNNRVSDLDICTIFANALDNAIEACERVTGERIIDISIRPFQGFLRIIMSNPTDDRVLLHTCKKNKSKHGYGLKNIRSCVEENGGQMNIEILENQFKLDILIRVFDEI